MVLATLLEGVGLRISTRSALVLLALALVIPASADESPKSLYHKGQQAEARQDYLGAYAAYKAAYDKKPTDLRYRSAFERLRFEAGAVHVKRGQQLRADGKLQEALQEFQTAAQIDPSSFIAQQEIQRTKDMIAGAASGTSSQQPNNNDILRKRLEQAEGPVELAPINDQAITLRISGDSKTIYQTIGKLAGINVLFDPDYVSRQLPVLELNGVTLREALSLVAIQSNTFWRPVTPNTIFVAPNTQTKRKDLEQSVVKTFYLTNAGTATEFQDIANTLRTILDITRVQPIAAENAIVVRGTPDQVALAEKIVSDLDKSRAEVIVDVAILQVSREKIHDLGLQPPLANGPIGVQLTTPNQTITTNNNNNNGNGLNGQNTTSTTTGGLTLNSFKNLNATNFSVSVPQASLNALLSDSNTRLLQNPQIRASDGQKADLKIGSRIPIATGSFQPGIGGVGINPLVNTQFQYQDVGVNITITPTVHLNGDVTLKVSMDISSETSTVNIGGIQQPVIGQRKIEHQIRLKEGEVNLLGGIFEDQDNTTYSGIPGLGQIPILKYLFGHENVDRRQDETVFVLIPHIVRDEDVSDINTRAIDVGTANSIELRIDNVRRGRPAQTAAAAAATAPQAAAAVGGQAPMQQPATPTPANPAANQAAPNSGGEAAFHFEPASVTTTVNGTFTVNVTMTGASDVASVPLQMSYDPKRLSLVKIDNGDLLMKDSQPVALVHRDDPATGTLVASAARPPGAAGVSGQGSVFQVTFMAKEKGPTVLSISRPGARNSQQQPIQALGSQMTVNVQ